MAAFTPDGFAQSAHSSSRKYLFRKVQFPFPLRLLAYRFWPSFPHQMMLYFYAFVNRKKIIPYIRTSHPAMLYEREHHYKTHALITVRRKPPTVIRSIFTPVKDGWLFNLRNYVQEKKNQKHSAPVLWLLFLFHATTAQGHGDWEKISNICLYGSNQTEF